MGVEHHSLSSGAMLVANAVKALFDMIYMLRRSYESVAHLENDLRIDPDELRGHIDQFSSQELEKLASSYRRKNAESFYQVLVREMK